MFSRPLLHDEPPSYLWHDLSTVMTLGAILWGSGVLGGNGRLSLARSRAHYLA